MAKGLGVAVILVAFGLEMAGLTGDYVVLHGGASLLLAWSLQRLLPVPYRRPRWLGLALLFSLAFFIPVLGGIGLATAVLLALYWPLTSRPSPFMEHTIPDLPDRPVLADPRARLVQRGLAGILSCANEVEARVRAVTAASRLPNKEAIPILRRALKDPADDVRLLAYVLLDRKEHTINSRIKHHQEQLAQAEPGDRARWHHRLAHDYWELCYLGLAPGDLRTHFLTMARQHVEETLHEKSKNPGFRLLHVRILINLGDYATARETLMQAMADGLPEPKALPYLAELAFHQRDFAAVRADLRGLGPIAHRQPGMGRVARFWLGEAPLAGH